MVTVLYKNVDGTTRYEGYMFDDIAEARAYVKSSLKTYEHFSKYADEHGNMELTFTNCIRKEE